MINRTTQKQLVLVVWGMHAIGVLCVATIAFAAYHTHGRLARERDSLEARRRDDLSLLARAEQVRIDHEAAVDRIRMLGDTLTDLKNRIPSSPREADFLAQVSVLAGQSGVRLKNFRPGQVTTTASVNTCDIQLSLMGSFANICKLLDGLHRIPRFLSVARLTLAGPPSAGDMCLADVTVSLCFAATTEKP